MAQVTDLRRRFRDVINRTSQAFLRSESLNTDGTTYAVSAVDTSNDVFTVTGDQTGDANLQAGYHIWIDGSTGNDALFEIESVSLDGSGDTDIAVKESIQDATADGDIVVDKDYDYVNFGRVKEASIDTDVVTSDMDQDGRVSSNLLEFTVSFTLQQGTNKQLSIVDDIQRPPVGGNTTNYQKGYDFYPNGHFLYFSGEHTLQTSTVNSAVQDDTDPAKDGKLLTDNGNYNLSDDTNGILFQNVLLNPGPTLDLSGGQNVIPIEFQGTIQFNELNSLNTDRKITISVSDFFDYA